MTYTVHQLAKLAGVSVRTLHHYDETGLLKPGRQQNGYRIYDEADLLTLQQILFFKELEFPLEEIGKMLKKRDFDIVQTLQEHRVQLEGKQKRLGKLLATVDKTLAKVTKKQAMTDEELFEAFWEKHENEYAAEAEARWGNTDTWKQSKERTKHLTKDDYKRMAKDGDAFMRELTTCMGSGPASEETQAMIAKHYESLRTFYDPTPELYRGLAQMYVDDPRFRAFYERFHPDMPEFMRDAMCVFCDNQ